jgi:hypothetical protein
MGAFEQGIRILALETCMSFRGGEHMSHKGCGGALLAAALFVAMSCISQASANTRADLAGRTLSCDDGSQISFSADGASTAISSARGTKRATVRWRENHAELWFPGETLPLGVDKDGDTYAFQEAACK